MRSVRPILAVIGPLVLALLFVSCATARRSVVLEPREDLLEAAQPTAKVEVFVLEGRLPTRPNQAWEDRRLHHRRRGTRHLRGLRAS